MTQDTREMLQKFAEKYAVIALCNLPEDYASRKRVVTNAILAALTNHDREYKDNDLSRMR